MLSHHERQKPARTEKWFRADAPGLAEALRLRKVLALAAQPRTEVTSHATRTTPRLPQPQREHAEQWSTPPDVGGVLAVERGREPVCLRGGTLRLAATCLAAALAGPRHRAARWTAAEASARGLPLLVVQSFEWGLPTVPTRQGGLTSTGASVFAPIVIGLVLVGAGHRCAAVSAPPPYLTTDAPVAGSRRNPSHRRGHGSWCCESLGWW